MKKIIIIASLATIYSLHAQSIDTLKFGPQTEARGNLMDDITAIVGSDVITRKELNNSPIKDKSAALQQLILRKLLLQAAKRYNINVGDTALNLAIDSRNNKTTNNSQYRERVRQDLIISRLQQSVVNNIIKISEQEIDNALDKQLQNILDTVNLVDILVKVPQSSNPEVLNQAQIKTQEIINKLKTQSAQQVANEYPEVDYNVLNWVALNKIPSNFAKVLLDVEINHYAKPIIDQDGIHILKVLDRKSTTKSFPKVAETQTSHILIKNSSTAQEKINSLAQQIRNGADFAIMAENYSQDYGSAAKGGDLDWVLPGQMVPEFESIMNKTSAGQISKPFKSSFGWHILKVHARRDVKINNQQMLRQQARKAIFQRQAAEEWELWVSQLRDEAYVEIR